MQTQKFHPANAQLLTSDTYRPSLALYLKLHIFAEHWEKKKNENA